MRKINLELIYDGEEDTLETFFYALSYGLSQTKHPRQSLDVNMAMDRYDNDGIIVRDETDLERGMRINSEATMRSLDSLLVEDEK